jgi:hypothetical protein
VGGFRLIADCVPFGTLLILTLARGPAIIVCMSELTSRNGTAPKAIKTDRCQAKECVRLGSLRTIRDSAGNAKWTYFMCDEHFLLLRESDKQYIARTEGTKVG